MQQDYSMQEKRIGDKHDSVSVDERPNGLAFSRPCREVALIDRIGLHNAPDLAERQRRGLGCNALLAGRRWFVVRAALGSLIVDFSLGHRSN
jgi:hypothetical protein